MNANTFMSGLFDTDGTRHTIFAEPATPQRVTPANATRCDYVGGGHGLLQLRSVRVWSHDANASALAMQEVLAALLV